MKLLSKEQQHNAKHFILQSARPLEQALYRYHFESGTKEDVLKQFETFQNSDGGFGHALEPDLRAPESSALATSVALNILRELETPPQTSVGQECDCLSAQDLRSKKGRVANYSGNKWFQSTCPLVEPGRFGKHL